MKKTTILLALLLMVSACGVKQTRELLTSGDYDNAIRNAIEGLQGNKNAKGKQDYVYLLEEAFAKAKERDLHNIETWVKEGNPQNAEKIYTTYVQLDNRQEQIRPLLPLKLLKEGRDAAFPFDNYADALANSKNALIKHLYDNSKALIATKDKMTIRRAYDDLMYLETLSPGYKDSKKLADEALAKGIDYVLVTTKNETETIIPKRLEEDLLNFTTYGLNDRWTIYHGTPQKGLVYDYGLYVKFITINLSPEDVKEKVIEKEKMVKDGIKNTIDSSGNIVKDGQGNPVKIDNMVTVKIRIDEFSQAKSCQVVAKLEFTDLDTGQVMNATTISGESVFSNVYATYKGDKRAYDAKYYPTFDKKVLPFPSNEQMVYDAGENLKAKLKDIIVKQKFRP